MVHCKTKISRGNLTKNEYRHQTVDRAWTVMPPMSRTAPSLRRQDISTLLSPRTLQKCRSDSRVFVVSQVNLNLESNLRTVAILITMVVETDIRTKPMTPICIVSEAKPLRTDLRPTLIRKVGTHAESVVIVRLEQYTLNARVILNFRNLQTA